MDETENESQKIEKKESQASDNDLKKESKEKSLRSSTKKKRSIINAKGKHKKEKKKKLTKKLIYMGVLGVIAILLILIFLGRTSKDYNKLNIDLYVMSQCPYGVQAENGLLSAAKKFGKDVHVNIEFIGSVSADGTLNSLHGPKEVEGDIIQLCVKKYYPEKLYDFILCQNKNYANILETVESCARENGIDINKLNNCKENEGKELFAESTSKAIAAQAHGSPTIKFEGKDYTSGRDELSFTRAICSYLVNHEKCKDIPICEKDTDCPQQADKDAFCENPGAKNAKCIYKEPVKFNVYVINDKKCTFCDTSNIVSVTKQLFKGAQIIELDVTDPKAKKFIKEFNIVYAPSYIFEKAVESTPTWKSNPRLASAFEKKGDYYKLLDSQTGASYFISEEARKEFYEKIGVTLGDNRPQIDFFVMSFCPFGNQAEEGIAPVYENLKKYADFNPRYVIYSNYASGYPNYCYDKENKYCSMHGIQELNQDIRELCVAKYLGMDAYFKFVLEINKKCNSQNADTCWEGVAESTGIDIQKVKECFSKDAISLLNQQLELNKALGVSGSPTVFIDGQEYRGGRAPADYQAALCSAFTSKPKECENIQASTTSSVPQGSC